MSLNDLLQSAISESTPFSYGNPVADKYEPDFSRAKTYESINIDNVLINDQKNFAASQNVLVQLGKSNKDIQEGRVNSFETKDQLMAFVSNIVDDEKKAKV